MRYREIELEKLVPHPANFPGREQKMEAEMLRSIEENGVKVPLIIRELDSGDFQILAGHRRFHALQSLDQMEVFAPCLITVMDDEESLDFVMLENLQRSELDPMDEAYAVEILMKQHGDSKEVADLLSRSALWVQMRQGLLELGEEAKEKVRERDLSLGAACAILKVESEDRELAEQLVLHPDFQLEPLNAKQAEETINTVILEPARERAAWESQREQVAWDARNELRTLFLERAASLNIQSSSFDDISMYSSSEFVSVRDVIPESALTVDAPVVEQKETELVGPEDSLRYLDLAQRHGAPVVVIPDGVVVNKKILLDGEKSRMEHGLQPWVADSVSKAISEECESDPDPVDLDDDDADALDRVEVVTDDIDPLAVELEWFIDQSRDGEVRKKVELGAAINFVLGVSSDAPIGFENLVHEDMSPGSRRLVLRMLCWCQGVDFWK